MPVDEESAEGHENERGRCGDDAARQPERIEDVRCRDAQVGDQDDAAHRREVQDAYRGHQEQDGCGEAAHAAQHLERMQGEPGDQGAEKNGGETRFRIECDPSLDLDGAHAAHVHGGNSEPEQQTANGRSMARGSSQTDRKGNPGRRDRDRDGKARAADTVGDGDSPVIGEHRDEMRRPYADAAGKGADRNPEVPLTACAAPGALEKQHRRDAAGKADDRRHHDQAPVMIIAYACNR